VKFTARSIEILLLAIAVPISGAAEEYELDWSSSFELRFDDFDSPADHDDVTGFFDLYEFSDNKRDDPAIQLGLTDFTLDLFSDQQTPLLRARLSSPTSNVGIGSDAKMSQSLLNQRGELLGRLPGLRLDIDYRRMRTDELRLFPNPTGVGGAVASTYTDGTMADDRFYTRRTGMDGELRFRPSEVLGAQTWTRFLSEITMRGGYGQRNGKRQVRSLIDFDWTGRTNKLDQEVTRAGGGLIIRPVKFITMAFDVDHERFRENASPLTEGAAPAQTIQFVPDTDRTTGRVRVNARINDRAVIHGGFQMSSLEQKGDRTPTQLAANLNRNKIRSYSGNAAADLSITDAISTNVFFKYDERNNRISRDTALFNPLNGTQVSVYLNRVRRINGGAEVVYQLRRMNQVALGFRGEWIDRDLSFAEPVGFLGDAILPSTTVVDDDTQTISGYVRLALRPFSRFQLSGEVGVQGSPDTGYIRALDDAVYGHARASYTPRLPTPVTLSVFARGRSGKNHDFQQAGQSLGSVNRDFDQSTYTIGGTLTGSPHERVVLYASVFHFSDDQDYPFIRSNDLRSFEASPFITLDFFEDQNLDYRSDLTVLTGGSSIRFTDRTDSALTYSFTRSNVRFRSNGLTATTIADASRIRSDIHRFEFELGHWVTKGLRVSTGYRYQKYRDPTSVTGAGVVPPFDLSTDQHTVVLGITLNNELLQ